MGVMMSQTKSQMFALILYSVFFHEFLPSYTCTAPLFKTVNVTNDSLEITCDSYWTSDVYECSLGVKYPNARNWEIMTELEKKTWVNYGYLYDETVCQFTIDLKTLGLYGDGMFQFKAVFPSGQNYVMTNPTSISLEFEPSYTCSDPVFKSLNVTNDSLEITCYIDKVYTAYQCSLEVYKTNERKWETITELQKQEWRNIENQPVCQFTIYLETLELHGQGRFYFRSVFTFYSGHPYITNLRPISLEFVSIRTCSDPVFKTVNVTNDSLEITCYIDKAYAADECSLEVGYANKKNRETMTELRKQEWTNKENQPVCQFTMYLETLGLYGEGTFNFRAVFTSYLGHPYFTDFRSIRLDYPKAYLEYCLRGLNSYSRLPAEKDGYIRPGIEAKCECKLKDVGKPPGKAVWFENGLKRNIPGNDLRVNASDEGKTFTCKGTSTFGTETTGVSFTPKFSVKASTPTCETVTLTGKQIRTKCTTAEVYPQANCQFTLRNGDIDRREIGNGTSYITYNHTDPQSSEHEYYSTSCTLQYPVGGLEPGNWTVQVSMYPDLTGVSSAQGTVGQAASTLMLSVPTVHIDFKNCPKGLPGEGDTNVRNGYIREGERASCLCTRAHAGNPPGRIGWSSTEGGNFVVLSEREDEAVILIKSSDTFTCQSTSVLNGFNSTTYIPKYAYGPSSASLTYQRPGPIFLCPSQQMNIDITCQVPANSFSPTALFTIREGNSNTLVTKEAGDTSRSKSVNYNFTRSGQHTFTCRAENAVLSDIFTEAPAIAIQVYETPKHPPMVSARNSKNNDVLLEGDDVTVTCDVSGGYPPVQSVTLTCDQHNYVTSKGTSAQLTLNQIKQTCNVINCTCQATHITGCYDMMGVLPLTVLPKNSTRAGVNEENICPHTTTDLVATAIGSVVGTLILEAAIGLIVFIIKREKARHKNRNKDEDQNVRDTDPNYLTIKYSVQASVPSSEGVKQKTERTYQNQAFGADTEATEPDLNVYSHIKD